MKKVFSLVAALIMLFSAFTGTVSAEEGIDKSLAGTTITVFNWGEYISDGSEGSLNVVAEFEKETGIKVQYVTYSNNEELYSQISNGGTVYDVIVPSDYMFERLLAEGYLQPVNFDNVPYYKNIEDKYKNCFEYINEKKYKGVTADADTYCVPYTVGMVGVIYDSEKVKEEPKNWDILWDEQYKDGILMFDNPRDAFAIAQFKLGLDINSTNKEDWQKAAEELKKQKDVLKRYANDEIFDIMEDGLATVGVYYAGDFLTMKENNDKLEFVYPKNDKGELITNQFIDVMCIPKNTKNKAAAEMFINYMLRADIAKANAEYICYASPNKEVVNNPEYAFSKANDEYAYNILYPAELTEFDTKLMFRHLPAEIITEMNEQWSSIKASGMNLTIVYIIAAVVIIGLVVLVVLRQRKKKARSLDEDYN